MSVAAEARAAALQFEVKKDGLSQLQDGSWVLKLKVHPNDMPPALLTAPMGTRYVAVVVEVSDDETPVSPEEQAERTKPAKDKKRWGELPLSQQAAIRCGEVAFRRFLAEADPTSGIAVLDLDMAAEDVRNLCRVHSRKDIKDGTTAGTLWRQLDAKFQAWMQGAA